MPNLELIDSGAVYRNPNPGYQYVFACHSLIAQVSGQEFLCTYQRGQALYSVDSVMARARSTDGGRTWADEGLLHDPAGDDRPYSYHGPFVSRMQDGELVVIAFRVDRSNAAKPLFNEATGGIVHTDTFIQRSSDKGRSWSKPQMLTLPQGMVLTPAGPVVELADGRWFLSFDQWHAFDAPGPYRPRTVGLYSTDRGRTWGHAVTFADGSSAGKGFWHGRIIRLRDDRLFTLFWAADMKTGRNLTLHASFGSPDGRQWTSPEPSNIPGQTNWPADLGGGRMLAIYTVRESQRPGFYVTFSTDGGRTWDLDRQINVWDATGRDKIGVSAPDAYPRSHDTIAFGAPTALAVCDNEVLLSFWCTELSTTHIRYARVRFT